MRQRSHKRLKEEENFDMNTAQTTKNLAQKIARQMAQEPLEILKTVKEQVGVSENIEQSPKPEDQTKLLHHQQEIQDKMKSSRLIEALERELGDIHKQDIFKDLQARITAGEIIPLEDYSELSMEQKQVLKAQMEAVTFQKKQTEYTETQRGGSLFGFAKKGRRMGSGQKQEAEKQQTRVEKPVPPSG